MKISPLLLLYFIFAYVLLFSSWWGYLLYSKSRDSFEELALIQKTDFVSKTGTSPNEYYNTPQYTQLLDKYNRQKKMVLSEGMFFMFILIGGFVFVRRSIKKELTLADRQKNFLLSITHELKSPLASIKLVLQTLLKRQLDEDKKVKFIHNSMFDVERLESLVDNILLAAKIENDAYGFVKEELDVTYLVSILEKKYEITNKKSCNVRFAIAPNVFMLADKAAISSLFVNLIENAIKYSEENSEVQVILQAESNGLLFEVRDNGAGISDEEKSKIFDKFYRVGNEETRKAKGTGLGLYIVKSIVLFHNGTIEVSDNIPKGTIFKVRFNMLPHGSI